MRFHFVPVQRAQKLSEERLKSIAHFAWFMARVRLKAGEGERVLAVFLDCGGKSDATPLSSERGGLLIAIAVVGAKAVSRPTCHRSP
ncbi:MAG: hypothetical protein EXS35_10195 [Pedosphaera sp.]|nr:hypothetical protein [Pedosphaera sp.]